VIFASVEPEVAVRDDRRYVKTNFHETLV